MYIKNFLLITVLIAVFQGCSSKTKIVLLPDPDGHVGYIDISNKDGMQRIDKAYESSTISSKNRLPTESKILSKDEIESKFKELLDAKPNLPKVYKIHFNSGSAYLQKDSKNLIAEVVKDIKARDSYEIDLIGHSDRAGSKKFNKKLSLKRVERVKKLLLDEDIDKKSIYTSYHGEENPIIKTPDGVSEPKNRRVEIIVK